jgi:TonB-dependent starch-binding outer membrane protein SusC
MQKIISVMYRIMLLLLIGFLHASATGYSQGPITINEKNAPLSKIFESIENQSGYVFLYQKPLVENLAPIHIAVKNASLEEALNACFKNLPITFKIVDKIIVLNQKEITPPSNLKLKVITEKGEPLAGATVTIKGTKTSMQADGNGELILTGITPLTRLIVSNVGYETQEIIPGKNNNIIVRLTLSVSKLDEVQVIAYGSVSKRLNTGDVSTIKSDVIGEQPVSNPLAALEGRVPGVYIQQFTGVPGSGFSMQIRGINSLRSDGNYPLYIVDGVPFPAVSLHSDELLSANNFESPLNNINPADIEEISILKDADATAIYGSRGANGVILITTKKGKAGKTKFTLNAYQGAGTYVKKIKLLQTPQYLEMRREAFKNDSATPSPYDYDLLSWDTTGNTDWQKTLLGGNARTTDIQGAISGGDNLTQFLIGGGYHHEGTVFGGRFRENKSSVHLNLAHHSADNKFNIQFSAGYMVNNNFLPTNDFTSFALTLPPDTPPLYDSAGNLNWQQSTWSNPLALYSQSYTSNTTNLMGHTTISYELFRGFQLKTALGYTAVKMDEATLYPSASFDPSYTFLQPFSFFANNNLSTWIIEPQAEFNRKLGPGQLVILAGGTLQQNSTAAESFYTSGFTSDALLGNIAAASSVSVLSASDIKYHYAAFFGRMTYNAGDRYIINLTGRRDGSSRFGPGKQFADFGALGAAWIFSKAAWIKELFPILSFGKLRGSYGITGSDQIPDYGFMDSYSSVVPYDGISGLTPSRLANSDYSWETNKKSELATELGFAKDRVFFSAAWYLNRSSNQLVGYTLPLITGFSSVQGNLPATVQNTGWEFSVNSTNVKSKNFTWTSSVNLTIPRNRLISFPGIASSSYANTYTVGKSLFTYKSFHETGVDPQTGVYQFDGGTGNKPTVYPSYPDDLKSLKEIAQKCYGGLQNEILYKGWRLDIFMQFVIQNGRGYLSYFSSPGTMSNQPAAVMARWQHPGDITGIQKFTRYGTTAADAYSAAAFSSDLIVTDASFMRVKNISLSYQFTGNTVSRWGLSGSRIYIQAQNLFTITRFAGIDPESQNAQALPPLRTVTAGIQLNF